MLLCTLIVLLASSFTLARYLRLQESSSSSSWSSSSSAALDAAALDGGGGGGAGKLAPGDFGVQSLAMGSMAMTDLGRKFDRCNCCPSTATTTATMEQVGANDGPIFAAAHYAQLTPTPLQIHRPPPPQLFNLAPASLMGANEPQAAQQHSSALQYRRSQSGRKSRQRATDLMPLSRAHPMVDKGIYWRATHWGGRKGGELSNAPMAAAAEAARLNGLADERMIFAAAALGHQPASGRTSGGGQKNAGARSFHYSLQRPAATQLSANRTLEQSHQKYTSLQEKSSRSKDDFCVPYRFNSYYTCDDNNGDDYNDDVDRADNVVGNDNDNDNDSGGDGDDDAGDNDNGSAGNNGDNVDIDIGPDVVRLTSNNEDEEQCKDFNCPTMLNQSHNRLGLHPPRLLRSRSRTKTFQTAKRNKPVQAKPQQQQQQCHCNNPLISEPIFAPMQLMSPPTTSHLRHKSSGTHFNCYATPLSMLSKSDFIK